MRPRPRWTTAAIVVGAAVAVVFAPAPARAGWQDAIGLTRLRAELGSAMPDGAGVPVTQVEATLGGNYLPMAGVSPITGTGNLSGKTLIDASGTSTELSTHAATVAAYFFGNNQALSMAPGVTDITIHEADDFTGGGLLNPGPLDRLPGIENSRVQNHSWIGSASDDDDLLRRFDFAIDRDGFVACVGLNNGSSTAVPPLMASAYNGIAVGRSDGGHSSGTTPGGVDGAGRIKPDLVVPVDRTSWATAITSSAAAMLLSTPQGAGQPSEVIKAVLLAGADKSPFPDWDRTPSRPLDERFGAGQLDVARSHAILASGEQEASGTSEVGLMGWDYLEGLGSGGGSTRFFSVPEGFRAEQVSIVLVWNRSIVDGASGPAFAPVSRPHDLALSLHASGAFDPGAVIDTSDGAVDNVEHIHLEALGSGQWAIRATGDSDKDHAIAWRATLVPAPVATVVGTTVPENGGQALVTVTLNEPSPLPVEFGFETRPGSARTADFRPVTGILEIPPGERTGTVAVPVIDDSLHEADERLSVAFSVIGGAVLSDPIAVVTIVDDDPLPAIVFEPGTRVAAESASRLPVGVALGTPSGRAVEVDFVFEGGTATPGLDHVGGTGTLVIPPGATRGEISLPILDDDLPEPDETVVLTVTEIRHGLLVGTPTLELVIVDDDFEAVLREVAVVATPGGAPGVTWPAVAGRRYTVQISANLVEWSDLPDYTDVVFVPGDESPVVVIAEAGTERCFARVVDTTPTAASAASTP